MGLARSQGLTGTPNMLPSQFELAAAAAAAALRIRFRGDLSARGQGCAAVGIYSPVIAAKTAVLRSILLRPAHEAHLLAFAVYQDVLYGKGCMTALSGACRGRRPAAARRER